jgi:hypothetical protein
MTLHPIPPDFLIYDKNCIIVFFSVHDPINDVIIRVIEISFLKKGKLDLHRGALTVHNNDLMVSLILGLVETQPHELQ